LAATVGTGNIAGVATAIAAGGPGAVFWMWLAAILGMTTKFAEVVLAVNFREKTEDGPFCRWTYVLHHKRTWMEMACSCCLHYSEHLQHSV